MATKKEIIQEYKQFMKNKRIDWGLTVAEMAEKLGYTSRYIYLIESGYHNISLNFIFKIQKAFTLSNDELKELKLIISKLPLSKRKSKENPKMQEYKKFIESKRIDWGLTVTEMAEKLGYPPNYLYSIESGYYDMPLDFILKMQKSFTLSNDELEELRCITSKLLKKRKGQEFRENVGNITMKSYKLFIYKKRDDWGINSKEMAEKLGYNPEYFSKVENGRVNMSLNFVEKVQETFDLSDDELRELKIIVSELLQQQKISKEEHVKKYKEDNEK